MTAGQGDNGHLVDDSGSHKASDVLKRTLPAIEALGIQINSKNAGNLKTYVSDITKRAHRNSVLC